MMKSKFNVSLLCSALVASTLAASSILSASVGQPHGRGFRPGRGGPRAIYRQLDLTEEQREQLRALREQAQSSGTLERLMETRKALNEAVENGADEGTIRQFAYDYGVAAGDAAVARARIHAQSMTILTPDQMEKYQTLVAERRARREERANRFQEHRGHRRNQTPDSF